MSTITTHILDTSLGKPAEGIRIELEYGGAIVGSGVTDADGRARDLVPKLDPECLRHCQQWQ